LSFKESPKFGKFVLALHELCTFSGKVTGNICNDW
jgi:hypothetical protein